MSESDYEYSSSEDFSQPCFKSKGSPSQRGVPPTNTKGVRTDEFPSSEEFSPPPPQCDEEKRGVRYHYHYHYHYDMRGPTNTPEKKGEPLRQKKLRGQKSTKA